MSFGGFGEARVSSHGVIDNTGCNEFLENTDQDQAKYTCEVTTVSFREVIYML